MQDLRKSLEGKIVIIQEFCSLEFYVYPCFRANNTCLILFICYLFFLLVFDRFISYNCR